MELTEYQSLARTTDQRPESSGDAVTIPLLGIAGEVGALLTEWKKRIRDGDSYHLFRSQVKEELGDVLWYLANIASKFDLSMEEIAQYNLEKTEGRWGAAHSLGYRLLDDAFPSAEQLPRVDQLEFEPDPSRDGQVLITHHGRRAGHALRDNAYVEDDYRYHDVFHLANAAVLGWSPVTRFLMQCKRKSDPVADDVEDGGRAIAIEEGISAYVFNYARDRDYFESANRVDQELLGTVMHMVNGLEVRVRRASEWELAILTGFAVWRDLVEARRGTVRLDLHARTLEFVTP
jgi:NTP pyrophosphatase (non-canonical NTP hydrolase)